MLRRPDNVKHLSEYKDGYILPSGIPLTKDIAIIIGEHAQLFMGKDLTPEEKEESERRYMLSDDEFINKADAIKIIKFDGVSIDETMSDEEMDTFLCHYFGGSCRVMLNPYYVPMICHSPPRPPMLLFVLSCASKGLNSHYTINLNSLWPTGNSPIQTELPYDIKEILR
jgi:hypothetical protein